MTLLLGLDKHFLAVGNRRRHETLLSGGVHYLSANTPMGVHSLTGADILIGPPAANTGLWNMCDFPAVAPGTPTWLTG